MDKEKIDEILKNDKEDPNKIKFEIWTDDDIYFYYKMYVKLPDCYYYEDQKKLKQSHSVRTPIIG